MHVRDCSCAPIGLLWFFYAASDGDTANRQIQDRIFGQFFTSLRMIASPIMHQFGFVFADCWGLDSNRTSERSFSDFGTLEISLTQITRTKFKCYFLLGLCTPSIAVGETRLVPDGGDRITLRIHRQMVLEAKGFRRRSAEDRPILKNAATVFRWLWRVKSR